MTDTAPRYLRDAANALLKAAEEMETKQKPKPKEWVFIEVDRSQMMAADVLAWDGHYLRLVERPE